MPVTYSIDPQKKRIDTVCTDPLTFEEVLNHFDTLQQDPACTGRLDVLLTVSDVHRLPQTSQLSVVSAEVRAVREKVEFELCAVVAGRDAMFGMMRIFEVFAGQYFRELRVFREKAEAEAWLLRERGARDARRK